MTLDEFMALKEGDKIEGMNGNVGTVTSAVTGSNPRGRSVAIEWAEHAPAFYFNQYQTAWMHWTKIEPEGDRLASARSGANVHGIGPCVANGPNPNYRGDVSTQSEDNASGERTNQVL